LFLVVIQPEAENQEQETRNKKPKTHSFHLTPFEMPCGKKRKRHKIATHKRKKRLRKNRHKKK